MQRVMEISTPLAQDVLLFHTLNAAEELGRLFNYEISVLSAKNNINPDDLLGKAVTVKLELAEDIRYFNGYVTRFSQTGVRGRYHSYSFTVRPWLWFLERRQNCRMFQQMNVPAIIKKIFDDYSGIADTRFELIGNYKSWEYCVQYRETDFAFISRLMEHEGIYYYFEHKEGRHTLVVCDSYSAHTAFAGYEQIPFIPQQRMSRAEEERISEWCFAREIQTGRYVIDDYDFTKPNVELQVKTAESRSHQHANYEFYDYPGKYNVRGDGEHYVRSRLEEIQSQYELVSGQSNARGICVGSLFELTGQPRDDQNREYLVVSSNHQLQFSEYESMEEQGALFQCNFTVLSSAQAFRSRRLTRKPFVQGPQTAVVVGPDGDEIYTDKYGRVKVQFHWDREGEKNQNSSCWIRVSHPWAGKNWGMVAIPRIGQEVIVDFLEGDPDQPIITGRVYNGEQMPPYALPGNMTQTGMLSRSSKTGSGANANELRFEDKKGSEQVYLHAEKNQDIEVENDETHWVGHDRKKTIDNDETTHVKHDRTETVDNNETITIGVNRTEKVGSNEKITIGANRNESVGANEDITIGANRTENVGANETITIGSNRTITVGSSETATVALQRTHTVGINETISVGAAQEITVGAAQAITVGAAQAITVGANQTTNVGAKQSVSVGSDMTEKIGGNQTYSVTGNRASTIGKDESIKISKNLTIDAGDSVTIKTGDASITMKKDGTITIKGKNITLDGSGKINVKASSDVVIKGSKVGIN